jgi:uncharacterized protein (DUF58 family)
MSFAATFPGFRLRLTRWGGIFLAAMLVLGFAAVNTGNNALMALLAVSLGSYLVSGTWSRQVLGRVEVRARLPKEVFAGRPTPVEVELDNRTKLFPGYGLVLRDRTGRVLIVEPVLAPSASRRHVMEVEFDARGWCELGPWQIEVVLPLGFFRKSKKVLHSQSVLVYPRLLPSSSIDARECGGRRSSDNLEDRGREGDVVQLRGFREGDDRRQLHWKQTARQQRLIVVDRERRAEQPVMLVVDPGVEDPEDPQIKERFEHMVSDVATGALSRLERGDAVGLIVGEIKIPPVRSPARAARLLRPLAEVQPVRLSEASPARPEARGAVVFSVGGES